MPTIKIKNSQTATNTPGSLVQGELAINEQDKILFYRDGAGAVQSFDLTTTGGGGAAHSVPFDVTNLQSTGNSIDLSSSPAMDSPAGVCFSNNGLKMYIIDLNLTNTNEYTYEFDLTEPYDVTTATYNGNFFDHSAQDISMTGVQVSEDGTLMTLCGGQNDAAYLYNLATAYDVTSASYSGTSFSFTGQDTSIQDITYGDSGSRLYMSGASNDRIYEYTCPTPYSIAGMSYSGRFISVSGQTSIPRDAWVSEDGTKMFMLESAAPGQIYQYTLSTPFEINSATYDSVVADISAVTPGPAGFAWRPDGTKLVVVGFTNDDLEEYQTSSVDSLDYTSNEKQKLASIEAGAEANPATTDELAEGTTNKYLAGNEVVSDTYITNIEAVTQAQYDALSPPDSNTFYTIVSTLPLPNTGYLDGVLASTMGDLDATISASYGGSGQTWTNLIASPADGSAQTDYDMFLGDTSGVDPEDPTFTGTAGSASAYFDFTSGTRTYMDIKTNTTILNQLQADTGQSWWIAVAFQAQTGTTSQFSTIWSNGGDNAGNEGIEVLIAQPSNIFGIQTRINIARNGTRIVNNFSTGNYTNGSDYLLIISYDGATDGMTVWKNTTTGVNIADINSGTGTVSSLGDFRIGDRINIGNSSPMRTNTRLYHVSYGNGFLTDSDVTSIKSHLETRHSRTYNAA